MNSPMHPRDRKLKTCKKLACMQTMGDGGGGGSESTEGITFHQYIHIIKGLHRVNFVEPHLDN